MSIKVNLRTAAMSKEPDTGKSRQRYFLDFYPAVILPDNDKPTRKLSLGLYIYNEPKTTADKKHNKEVTAIAEQYRDKMIVELNKPEVYSIFEKQQLAENKKSEKSFFEFYKVQANKRTGKTKDTWLVAIKYLQKFTQGKLRFCDLTETLCNDFKAFLLSTPSFTGIKLSQNSAGMYFLVFKSTLRQAYKDGYLKNDLNAKIETIKIKETHRNYLTLEELNALVRTPATHPAAITIRQAALFSALTGLRYSDIEKLTWGELQHSEAQGHYLQYTQRKTKNTETLQISTQALQLLGERGVPTAKVFPNLQYSTYYNKLLAQWIKAAGITKHITFHSFRHTYATLLLTQGIDLYTVSKMLGHRDLETTQIYAKVIDSKKRTAADSIHLDFDFSPDKK